MKVVVDHIRGSRLGQRQEFAAPERLSIGRHPKCDVPFDAHRDLDASSRHAELRQNGESYVLSDVGSSNGTFVGGDRVSEVTLEVGKPVVIEFGAGGPQLRIWLCTDDMTPEPFEVGGRTTWRWIALAIVGLAIALLAGMWLAR